MSDPKTAAEASLRLDVACNDPDNGIFAHRAENLQVRTWDGADVEFCCQRVRAPRFVETGHGFRFMRSNWTVLRSKEWFGNWCWNAYWLRPADLVALLVRVRASGMFSCEHGPTPLFENWNDGGAFDRDLWMANLWGRPSIGVAA